MKCPHCNKSIDDKTVARHFASAGGKKSRRTLLPETAKAMVEARKKKKKELANESIPQH